MRIGCTPYSGGTGGAGAGRLIFSFRVSLKLLLLIIIIIILVTIIAVVMMIIIVIVTADWRRWGGAPNLQLPGIIKTTTYNNLNNNSSNDDNNSNNNNNDSRWEAPGWGS